MESYAAALNADQRRHYERIAIASRMRSSMSVKFPFLSRPVRRFFAFRLALSLLHDFLFIVTFLLIVVLFQNFCLQKMLFLCFYLPHAVK